MKLKRIITLLLLFIFILTNNSYAETKNIGNDEIKRLMSLGIPLIDVRRKDEWVSTGVIENTGPQVPSIEDFFNFPFNMPNPEPSEREFSS